MTKIQDEVGLKLLTFYKGLLGNDLTPEEEFKLIDESVTFGDSLFKHTNGNPDMVELISQMISTTQQDPNCKN
jgi:hypothetical protein